MLNCLFLFFIKFRSADVAADVFAMEGSTKFELGRTRFLLEKVRENVEEAQMQIAAAKGER